MKNTKKVLVDTSTLFSGLGWTGPPFRVLAKIHEEEFKLILTDYIIEELSDHLEDFSDERRKEAFQSLEYLRESAVIVENKWKEKLNKAEKLVGENKDAPIMAAFLLDEVDILITSDLKDFPIEKFEQILTPKDFLKKY